MIRIVFGVMMFAIAMVLADLYADAKNELRACQVLSASGKFVPTPLPCWAGGECR
jgi:hypothetical protein